MKAMSRTLVVAAERSPLPARFDVVEHYDRPAMIIVDRITGKTAIVSLYAYGATREALTDLFGGDA